MNGPCAKTTVKCTLITVDGEHIIGENWCVNPQKICPRTPGEGYKKCKSICQQEGHAEAVAVRLAGDKAKGATAYIEGHTYACMDCQHALFGAGVAFLTVGQPPSVDEPPEPDLDTCPVCGGPADNGFSRDLPPVPYYCKKCNSSSSDTLLTPQATTAENSHSQNPSNNSVSGTGGDLDHKGN